MLSSFVSVSSIVIFDTFITFSRGSLIYNYTSTYNLTAVLGQSKNLSVITIVIVSNAQLWFDNNYSFVDIQMFDTDLKNQLFPDVDFNDADLLIFQGNATKMQNFVDEKLECFKYSLPGIFHFSC